MTTIQGSNAAASCHCPSPADQSNPTHASTSMQGGKAVFENDNYRITAGDDNSVTINNKHTGETYEVWGDPHVKVDGQQAFDFHGTTTFSLEDGTKVTLRTTPSPANDGTTLTSSATITNGDYGARISGIDSNTGGDLKVDEAKGYGELLDNVTADGNTVQENPAGKGFLAVDDNGKIQAVDQNYMSATELKGAGEKLSPLAQAFEKLGSLLKNIHVSGQFGGGHSQGPDQGQGHGGCHGGHGHHNQQPSWGQPSWGQPSWGQPSEGHHNHRPHHGSHSQGNNGGNNNNPLTSNNPNPFWMDVNTGPDHAHGLIPDPLGLGSAQNQQDHNPLELALDPLGIF